MSDTLARSLDKPRIFGNSSFTRMAHAWILPAIDMEFSGYLGETDGKKNKWPIWSSSLARKSSIFKERLASRMNKKKHRDRADKSRTSGNAFGTTGNIIVLFCFIFFFPFCSNVKRSCVKHSYTGPGGHSFISFMWKPNAILFLLFLGTYL